jgi:CheY-like chemotaxis protein
MSNNTPRKPFESTESVPLDAAVEGPPMLVIAADETARSSLVRHYSASGWSVRCAASMREAIDGALEHQPDVIVLDLLMPEINPRHLVQSLRGTVEHDLRVIGIARTSPTMFEDARQAGVDVVFPVPIDLVAVDAFLAMKPT